MRLRRFAEVDRAFREQVRGAVTGLGDGDTRVLDAEVDRAVDADDRPVWRVTLVLPRPRQDGWDVEKTVLLKREARRVTDDIPEERDLPSDGTTSVVVTTHEAPETEIAEDDVPEPDELARPGEAV